MDKISVHVGVIVRGSSRGHRCQRFIDVRRIKLGRPFPWADGAVYPRGEEMR